MNSKVMMTNDQKQEGRNIVDRIRDRVPPKLVSSSSSLANASKQFDCVRDCCHTQILIQNHSNFKRSGPPGRFLYYEDGSWLDFSNEVLDSLKSGFLEGKPVVEVPIEGAQCLFDFYRMLQIDFENQNQRSIAWIDVDGKCFFPKTCVGGGGDVSGTEKLSVPENTKIEIANVTANLCSEYPKIELEIRIGENSNSNSNWSKRKRESVESEYEGVKEHKTEGSSSSVQHNGSRRRELVVSGLESRRWPKAKLLKEGEKVYSLVKNMISSWLGIAQFGATITAIHEWDQTGPLDRARHEVFRKQIEITKAARGESNMTFAWYGTSAKGVASILNYGFGMPSQIAGSQAHGVGIYLSPSSSTHISAMLSEADDNGEKHIILCRVILGKCEKVEAGSQQSYPSSVDFDTGVDDLKNPRWYVVWRPNMNTHILPSCVVSYKPSSRVPADQPSGTSVLFAKLRSKLGSSLKVGELRTLCRTYKDGKLEYPRFMKQLGSIVGNEILLSTIREIRGY